MLKPTNRDLCKSRKSAIAKNRRTYYTGKPCPRGHVAARLTSSCYCTRCNTEDGYRWNRNNPEGRRRFARIFNKYPEPTRPRPTTCECCGAVSIGRVLALDHCHVTGKFRGWLCAKCNTGLGKFGDNIDGLLKAVQYLAKAVHAS